MPERFQPSDGLPYKGIAHSKWRRETLKQCKVTILQINFLTSLLFFIVTPLFFSSNSPRRYASVYFRPRKMPVRHGGKQHQLNNSKVNLQPTLPNLPWMLLANTPTSKMGVATPYPTST